MTAAADDPLLSREPPPRRHDALAGVDSDGCVFATMEVKQCRHFHPLIIRWWGLEAIAPLVRETAGFVNLRSAWRGADRFVNLLRLFELLAANAAARAGAALPDLTSLRAYCRQEAPRSNATLAEAAARTGDPELARVLAWSRAVDADIATRMAPVPPFAWARRGLERLAADCDLVVVSQTPEAALAREWRQHGLAGLPARICGQERGSKRRQLEWAAAGRYPPGRVLMIGDAPGDLEAAEACGALFYPVMPGAEEDSWRRLHEEACDRFLAGRYAGDYAETLKAEFRRALPAWEGTGPAVSGR